MAWTDRIQEAAYTPEESGFRMSFTFEDVSTSFDKKGSAWQFVDADGTYVQGLGKTDRRFPMIVIFHGADCDLEADSFMDLLGENGVGKLEHPLYGTVDVIPLGTIRRRDDLKTAANQVKIEVTFWQTLGVVYPQTDEDLSSIISAEIETFNNAASAALGENLDIANAVDEAGAQGFFERVFQTVAESMREIADIQADVTEFLTDAFAPTLSAFDNVSSSVGSVQSQFDSIYSSITRGIDALIKRPITLANQTLSFLQTPGRAYASITNKFIRYRNVIDGFLNLGIADLKPGSSRSARNNFQLSDMMALGSISGAVTSVVSQAPSSASVTAGQDLVQFQTRAQAIEAAEELLSMLEDVTVWREANYESLGDIDTGEAYQAVHRIATLGAGALVEIAFSMKQERSIVLDRPRNMVELEFELYGTIDDNLNFLISSNDLTGDEMFELPVGREILYYV
jgi:prophage DNA circulation protein